MTGQQDGETCTVMETAKSCAKGEGVRRERSSLSLC